MLWRVHRTHINFWFPSSDLDADFSASLHLNKRLGEHEEYQALHKLHGLGLTINCRSPKPTIIFMIILSLELTESTLWMPRSQKWFLCVTYIGRSQEGQTHHTRRYHKPANHNWLMKTQLIRILLEKQTAAQIVKKFAKFYRIQRLITVHFSTLVRNNTVWLKTEAIFITFHHSFVWDWTTSLPASIE